MSLFLVLGGLWTTIFVAIPMLLQRRVRKDLSHELARPGLPENVGPIPVQILFADVAQDHVRLDCVLLADTSAHEAGYPLTLRIARPAHPAVDGAMKRALAALAERLAEVDVRFGVRNGEPQISIERGRTSVTFDLDTAA
jgi:hypothetical protein